MYNNNDNCECEKKKGPCSPNPHHKDFDRVVATWQTVRHYKVSSYDTIEPVCGGDNWDNENFERFAGGSNCGNGCRNNGGNMCG